MLYEMDMLSFWYVFASIMAPIITFFLFPAIGMKIGRSLENRFPMVDVEKVGMQVGLIVWAAAWIAWFVT